VTNRMLVAFFFLHRLSAGPWKSCIEVETLRLGGGLSFYLSFRLVKIDRYLRAQHKTEHHSARLFGAWSWGRSVFAGPGIA
jgi:hypothetical protein